MEAVIAPEGELDELIRRRSQPAEESDGNPPVDSPAPALPVDQFDRPALSEPHREAIAVILRTQRDLRDVPFKTPQQLEVLSETAVCALRDEYVAKLRVQRRQDATQRTSNAVEAACRLLREDNARLTAEGTQLKNALAEAQMTIDDFEMVGMVLGKKQQRFNPQQLADKFRRLLEETDAARGNEKKRVTQSKQKPKGAPMATAKKPKTQVAMITQSQLKQIFQLQGRLAQVCPDSLDNLELNEDELGQYTQVKAKEHLEVLMKKLLIATTAHAQAAQEGVKAKDGLEAITRALAAVPDDQLMPENVVRKYTDLKSQVKSLTQQQDEAGRQRVDMIRSTAWYQNVSLALGVAVLLVLIVLVVVWPKGSGANVSTPSTLSGSGDTRPYDFSDLVPKESAIPSMTESEWDQEEEEVDE